MTNFELSVINAVTAANAASFITLCYTTTCGFPKKSGLDKVEKMVILTQAQVNRDYEKAVNNALKKQGLAPTFKTQAPRGKTWVQGLENLVSESADGTRYLRFCLCKGTKTQVVYIENGQPCDQSRIAQIKAYLAAKGKSECGTQAAVGLKGDEQIEPRDITIAKLHYLKIGGATIANDQAPLQIAV